MLFITAKPEDLSGPEAGVHASVDYITGWAGQSHPVFPTPEIAFMGQ